MDPRTADRIFWEASQLASDEARADYLQRVCGEDHSLRRKVERLLAVRGEAEDFLESPPHVPDTQPAEDHPPLECPGATIGPYKLLEQIGEGGMGVVYYASQREPIRRTVALKIIKPGLDTREVVKRFEAERQALAMMDHPNIAKVLDAGATDTGRPYFAMEMVKGKPINEYCDREQFPTRERLTLFIHVCHGVQHAHQKGVIHRDIKPSNLLIEVHDVRPVPKIIDFGIAKAVGQRLTDQSLHTNLSQMVGTPLYMSPEQAGQSSLDVDTRSDVYSLGVVLYELLTGTTPFEKDTLQQADYGELRRLICEVDPPRPSARVSTLQAADLSTISDCRKVEPHKLSQQLRGELDWIVMKALDKDRDRRYESASALAEDIERYLRDEPVLAGPPSAAYRLRKFARRNKRGLFTASAVSLVLLLGVGATGGSAGYFLRDREVRLAEAQRAVESALDEATALEQQGKWSAALAAAQRAQAFAESQPGNDALQARVQQQIKDLTMVLRVEEIRLEVSTVQDDRFDWNLGIRAYLQAFRDYGIDVEALTPEEAGRRMPADDAVRNALATAFDDWARLRRGTPEEGTRGWEHLIAVARAADLDPWRNRLRGALLKYDRKTAQSLLAEVSRETLQTSQVLLLRPLLTQEEYLPLLRDAQLRHPADLWLNHQLAWTLSHGKSVDAREALRFYQAALALRPDSPGILVNLGRTLSKLDRHGDAIAVYERAIQIKPDYAAAYCNLGNELDDEGDRTGAEKAYRTSIQIDPKCAAAQSNLGGLLNRKGDLSGAEEALRTAIQIDPHYVSAYYNLGITLSAKGGWAEAENAYREAIRLNPGFTEAHCNLGVVLARKGDLAGAEETHRKAIQIDPQHAQAYSGLGGFLCDYRQDYDGAIAAFHRAIELGLKDGRAHFNLGNALFGKGALTEAITAYRQAVALNPKDGEYHCWLGEVLRRTGQTKEAIEALQTAITLSPKLAAAHASLGSALADNGDLDGAVTHYQQANRLNPNDAENHYALSTVLARQESWDAAIAEVREAIRCQPDFAEAHCNLGRLLQTTGQLRAALESLQRGHELGSKSPKWKIPTARWIQECQDLIKESEAPTAPDVPPPTVEPAPAPAGKEGETSDKEN